MSLDWVSFPCYSPFPEFQARAWVAARHGKGLYGDPKKAEATLTVSVCRIPWTLGLDWHCCSLVNSLTQPQLQFHFTLITIHCPYTWILFLTHIRRASLYLLDATRKISQSHPGSRIGPTTASLHLRRPWKCIFRGLLQKAYWDLKRSCMASLSHRTPPRGALMAPNQVLWRVGN